MRHYHVRKRKPSINYRERPFVLKALDQNLRVAAASFDGPGVLDHRQWHFVFPANKGKRAAEGGEMRGLYAGMIEQESARRLDALGMADTSDRQSFFYAASEAFINAHQHGPAGKPVTVEYVVTLNGEWIRLHIRIHNTLARAKVVGYKDPPKGVFHKRGNGLGLVRDASDAALVTIKNGKYYQVDMIKYFPQPALQQQIPG